MARGLMRTVAVAIGALLLIAVAAWPASAHASLIATTPADGQQLDVAPDEIVLEFTEPVTLAQNALRIFDGSGERVPAGDVAGGGTPTLTAPLADDVDDGAYVATYRVTSADGHVIRGAFVFTVGAAGGVDDALVAQIFAGGGSSVTAIASTAVRVLTYAGMLLAAGAVTFAFVVASRDAREDLRRAGRWVRLGTITAMAATVLGIPLAGMVAAGVGPLAALSPAVLGGTLAGSVGQAALIRLVALAVLLVAVARPADVRRPLTAGGAVLGLGSFLWDGHTRTVEPLWLMLTGDAAHLLAAATWFGGLVVFVAALRARRLDDDPIGGARLVSGFSRLATVSIVVVSLAGLAMSVPLVRAPRTLVTTDYGWTLLVKVALVIGVLLIGAYNQRRLVPLVAAAARRVPAGGSVDTVSDAPATDRLQQASAAAWATLRRTVRFEVIGLVLVLAVTGFLVNQRPAAEAAGITGAYQTTVALSDDLDVDLVIDPNRAGPNVVHLYVLDQTGRPAGDVDDVTLRMSLAARDLGPIVADPDAAGPGHWALYGEQVPLAGEWVFEVVVGVDELTEESVEIPVYVNP